MSRPPLQGRVEEIIIREPKPSWGSRIGDVLGDVFSGIGAAVREYGPAVLQGLASSYSSAANSYQPYDISPSSLSNYSSSSRTVRIQAPEPIKQRPLPEPRQTPRLMETYGRSLQEQRARRQQQIEDLMATNEQAANRRGIAGQLGQYTQPGSHVQPSRRQPSVDFHPSQGTAHSLADYLNPSRTHSSPIQEDYGWVQDNLARAQRPVTWEDQVMRQQAQQQAQQEQQARDAQRQRAQAQHELAEAQLNNLRREIFERGERATGRKSHLSPKRVSFNGEGDLTDKLWDHFYHGEGQPVEVDLRKVNLNEDLNMPRLLRDFNSSAVTLMRFPNPSKKALQGQFKAKNPTIDANPKVTHIILGKPFTDVTLDITREDDPEQWAAFGRLAVDVNKTHILIDHTSKTVTVDAELGPYARSQRIHPDLIEEFDFNPDPDRGIIGEIGTRAVHHFAPPGSTSYQIRRVPGTTSHFRQIYSFRQFFGY